MRARRGTSRDREEAYRETYREAKKALCIAISKAKAKAWDDLLKELDENPWGLAYKVVRNKLRRWSPPTTESLEGVFLERVVGTLFPKGEERTRQEAEAWVNLSLAPWREEWDVTVEEMSKAIKRMTRKNTAPEPDGIPDKVVGMAYRVIYSRVRELFTRCLREGWFPHRGREHTWCFSARRGSLETSHRSSGRSASWMN